MEFFQQAMDHIGGNLLNIGDSLESRNLYEGFNDCVSYCLHNDGNCS